MATKRPITRDKLRKRIEAYEIEVMNPLISASDDIDNPAEREQVVEALYHAHDMLRWWYKRMEESDDR